MGTLMGEMANAAKSLIYILKLYAFFERAQAENKATNLIARTIAEERLNE